MNPLDARSARLHQPEAGGIQQLDADRPSHHGEESADGGHSRWMMIACCVPMLAIAVVLVATGVAGAGLIVVAVMCTAMMAMMMGGMSRGERGEQ